MILDGSISGSVVVVGAKPGAALPDIAAPVVLTANNAVEVGLLYREKYGSRIIALASSRVLRDRKDVQEAFIKSAPEEIVLLGDDLPDAAAYVRERLGLPNTSVTVLSESERNRLILDAIGWRSVLLNLHTLSLRGFSSIRYVIKVLLGRGTAGWLQRSTGLNAILYAQKRFPGAKEIIVSGIGLQAGAHFSGPGRFFEKDALADRVAMQYWVPKRRKRVYTTDSVMRDLGKIREWKGEVFHYYSPQE